MKEIVVPNGQYTKKDGTTGTNWIKVGVLGVSSQGKEYVILEPHINLAGLPRSEKGGVMCSVIDKSLQQNMQPPQQPQGAYQQQPPQGQPYQQQPQQQSYQQPPIQYNQ
jgi:hypothetical protein